MKLRWFRNSFRNFPDRSGWSLIELLIGLSIFALIATGVYTSLSVGISAWRRADLHTQRTQELRTVLEKMASDLRNSFPTPGIDQTGWTPLEGKSDEISFPTRLFTRSPKEPEGHWQVAMVRYAVSQGRLLRWVLRDLKQPPNSEERWKDPEVWVEGVSGLRFQYAVKPNSAGPWKELLWKESWGGKEPGSSLTQIPSLVKITISLKPSSGSQEGGASFSTQIHLPMGTLMADEEAMEGEGG